MSKVTIEYFGMEGTGATVTEAKRDAGRKIEKALTGYYFPRLVRCHKLHAFVYRQPDGWYYGIYWGDDQKDLCTTGGFDNIDEAVARARRHMADAQWSRDVADDEEYLKSCNLSPADAREVRSRIEHHRKLYRLTDQGFTVNDAQSLLIGLTQCMSAEGLTLARELGLASAA